MDILNTVSLESNSQIKINFDEGDLSVTVNDVGVTSSPLTFSIPHLSNKSNSNITESKLLFRISAPS